MDSSARELCDVVAAKIVAKDFSGLRAELADWLRAEVDEATLAAWYEQAMGELSHPPKAWSCDEGAVGLDELREPSPYGPPSRPLSPRVTAENFRGWLSIQLVPDESAREEQYVCFDVWLVAVVEGGRWRVGYLELAEPT